MSDQGAEQHYTGGDHIAEAIGSRGHHGGGIQLFAQLAVKKVHPAFDQDGDRQDDDRQQRKFHWGRGENLLKGGFTQLKAHQQDDHRNGQPGEVLYPTVAEGVMPIGFLPSQPETDECDHRGTGIG